MDRLNQTSWADMDLSLFEEGFTPSNPEIVVSLQRSTSHNDQVVLPHLFKFESGSRVLEAPPSPSEESSDKAVDCGKKYVCLCPGCKSTNPTFGRVSDLERHMGRHFPKIEFTCHAVGCKLKGRKRFYRLDKLDQHIRHSYDANTRWNCPDPACTTGPMSSEEFLVHLTLSAGNSDELSFHHEYLGRVSIPVFCDCPFTDCSVLNLFPKLKLKGFDKISQFEKHLRLEHCCKNARDFSRFLLGEELKYLALWDHNMLKRHNGICPVCQTDMMAWKGHDMGDHMRQTHGPDVIQACAEKIRNMEIFSYDGLLLSNFVIQFPELLRDEEIKYLSEGTVEMRKHTYEFKEFPASLETPATEKGWFHRMQRRRK